PVRHRVISAVGESPDSTASTCPYVSAMKACGPLAVSSLVVAARDQVSCDVGGEAAILQLASGVYYSVDAVGSRIWALLHNPRSVREIRDTLLAEYDVPAARCERDLLGLLQALAPQQLVEVQHDAAR